LLTLQLRVIEKTDFEQRVAKLEKQLDKLKDRLQDPRVKAWREEERQQRNDEALGKRPAQAVKPYGSNDGKVADQSELHMA
jgi:predicted  nucleic acid-binding Zn-ribbon protein